MSPKTRFWIFSGIAAALILGSWVFFLHLWNDAYWNDGRYTLVAVARLTAMNLSYNEGEYFTQLVGPTIYAVGANERYVVVKQHPLDDKTGIPNRAITHFYLIARISSDEADERQKGIRGPLTKAEFDNLSKTFSLPQFSKIFPELE